MVVLIITQYFWPENFRINSIVQDLQERGYEVIVLTGIPNYPEGEVFASYKASPKDFDNYKGAKIIRVPHILRGKLKLTLVLNYLSFVVMACLIGPIKLIGKRVDVCFVYEPSPITVGIPAIVVGKYFKKTPIVFWVLDLWPETLHALGMKNVIVSSLIRRLASWIYQNCNIVLGQSKSFVKNLKRNYPNLKRVEFFPSFSELDMRVSEVNRADEVSYQPNLLNIVFTGNIGEAQDFDNVIEAAKILKKDPVRWIIVGDGRDLPRVRKMVSSGNLDDKFVFTGKFPLEKMTSFMAHADCLLVSLKQDPVFSLTIPAKVQAYLTSGVPLIGMLDGEGADVIEKSNSGLVANAGDFRGLANNIRQLIAMSNVERKRLGRNGRSFYMEHFDKHVLLNQLAAWLNDVKR